MTCVDTSHLAMRNLDGVWFVKNIPRRRYFQLDGGMAVLWDALLNCDNHETAIRAFGQHFANAPEALRDAPYLIEALKIHELLPGCYFAPAELPSDNSSCFTGEAESDIQSEMCRYAIRLNRPLIAEYEMTYRCNLRCLHCYQPAPLKRKRLNELGKDEITTMLHDFADAGVFFLVVTGGECTLHPNFPHVIKKARENHFDISIITNGTGINLGLTKLLSDSCVSEVVVSIYGWSASEYDRFTRLPSAFSRVRNNLIRLRDAGIHVVARVVVTSVQEKTFRRTLAELDDLDIETRVLCHIMPAMDGGVYPLKYRVSTDTLRGLFQDGLVQKSAGRVCTAGRLKFRVSPDGFVTLCELERRAVGNIREDGIQRILSSPQSQCLVSTISESGSRAMKNPMTAGLPCPLLSALEHGSLDIPSLESIRWTEVARCA